jgi:F0F1-type ATP synthase assembly protein I
MGRWNWTSVGKRGMVIALLTLSIVVGAQTLMTMFLGWFVEALAEMSPWGAIVIFVASCVVRQQSSGR